MVSGSSSDSEGSDGGEKPPLLTTYSKTFHDQFPYYIALGMTEQQYWDGDPDLTRVYRKADEIRSEKQNQMLWLQGMYVYEAMCDVAPIFRSHAKRGTRARPYPSKPYTITAKARKQEKVSKERKVYDKGKARMEALVQAMNKKFGPKNDTPGEVNDNGD